MNCSADRSHAQLVSLSSSGVVRWRVHELGDGGQLVGRENRLERLATVLVRAPELGHCLACRRAAAEPTVNDKAPDLHKKGV